MTCRLLPTLAAGSILSVSCRPAGPYDRAEVAPSKRYVNVMPGDSLQYRFVPRVPGAFMYPFVTHAFADATKGAVGVLRVLEPGQKPGTGPQAMTH